MFLIFPQPILLTLLSSRDGHPSVTICTKLVKMGGWEYCEPGTMYVAKGGGMIVASSNRVYSVNRRIYFPSDTVQHAYLRDSAKKWT
ncbi:hypothetical protein B484DRAFT_441248 [Ochromonadaceae sp. CCMP2298]|nr:hypothetical protein B484DRAFT_441248 [Ochromonadaceae sp. CCMP2298]